MHLNELYFEINTDMDKIDRQLKEVTFPFDEYNFKNRNFLKIYKCSEQYNVLKEVCINIMKAIKQSNIKNKNNYYQDFKRLLNTIPNLNFETLRICNEAEKLKIKYGKYLVKNTIILD